MFDAPKGSPLFKMSNTVEKSNYQPKNDSDALNPEFLFNSTATDLLIAIANGEIKAVELAKKQLENRGLDLSGKWIGFTK